MDIKSITPINLPSKIIYEKSDANSKINNSQNTIENNEKSKKSYKKLSYIGAGIVLAGLGVYVGRNKIGKFFKKEISEKKDELKNAANEIIEQTEKKSNKIPQGTEEIVETVSKENASVNEFVNKAGDFADEIIEESKIPEEICVGFENGKPIYEKYTPVNKDDLAPLESAYDSVKKSINFDDEEIISLIEKNKIFQNNETERIILENTENGHIDFNKLRKAAHDISCDESRGKDGLHQAADLLEQAYLKEYVKGDETIKSGIYNFFDFMKTDTELFSVYTKMPKEESVGRLNYLKNHELKSSTYKGMTADDFFEQAFNKLVEKYQFKKYSEYYRIDGNFNDVMQMNQSFRKETSQLLKSLTDNEGNVSFEKLIPVVEKETNAHKAANFMEKALHQNYVTSKVKSHTFEEFEEAFLENKTLFDIYKKMPKEQAVQRVNALRRFRITPFFKDVDEQRTNQFLDKAIDKLI